MPGRFIPRIMPAPDVRTAVAPAGAPVDPGASPDVPVLEARGVRKSFGHHEVLKGVDLVVRPQELVFIIGPSGSGKSTLLRCCNRLEEPSGGSVKVFGMDILAKDVDINKVRTRIGMVFQSFNLYPHMTALENVTLALRKVSGMSRAAASETGMRMLERVGLSGKAAQYPNQLSGGQQQRVAIARTLALGPGVVLFDEPTSALDPELVGGILAIMRQLRESGMTMVVVSHEMRFAREAADRVVFMADGLVVEEGSAADVFTRAQHPRTREFLAQLDH